MTDIKNFRNFTPHTVKLYLQNGDVIEIPSEGRVYLISEQHKCSEITVNGCIVELVSKQIFTGVKGLPDDTTKPIIIPMVVGEYLDTHPSDYKGCYYSPDTSPEGVVRDTKGDIIGTKRLVTYGYKN